MKLTVLLVTFFSMSVFANNFHTCLKIQKKIDRVCSRKGDDHPRCVKLKQKLAQKCSDQERLDKAKAKWQNMGKEGKDAIRCKKLHRRTVRACDRRPDSRKCNKRKTKLQEKCGISLE